MLDASEEEALQHCTGGDVERACGRLLSLSLSHSIECALHAHMFALCLDGGCKASARGDDLHSLCFRVALTRVFCKRRGVFWGKYLRTKHVRATRTSTQIELLLVCLGYGMLLL